MSWFQSLWRWIRRLLGKREQQAPSITKFSPRAERRRAARGPWKRFAARYHLKRGQKGVKLSAVTRIMFEPEKMKQKPPKIKRRWPTPAADSPAGRALADVRARQAAEGR